MDIATYVKIGETIYPLAKAGIDAVIAFAHSNGGTAEIIAQLEANKVIIEQDRKSVADELARLDAEESQP